MRWLPSCIGSTNLEGRQFQPNISGAQVIQAGAFSFEFRGLLVGTCTTSNMSLPARFEDFEALASADRHIVYEYLEKDEKEWNELLRQWDEHVVHNASSVSNVEVSILNSAVSEVGAVERPSPNHRIQAPTPAGAL